MFKSSQRPRVMKLPSPSPPPLLLLILLAASIAISEAPWVDCGDAPPSPSPSPSPSSSPGNSSITPFRANLLKLLDELPHAAAAAPTGFASLSLGAGPDRVFVRGLCRGDMGPPQCLAYMEQAAGNLSERCPASRRAAVWFDVYVTFADTKASTPHEEAFQKVIYDSNTVDDPAAYNQTYSALMSRLVARATATGGAGEEAGRPLFATGQALYDANVRDAAGTTMHAPMYGLVQCFPDRTAADCALCLQDSVRRLAQCCSGYQRGVVLGYYCHMRIQIYPFYYDLAVPSHAAAPPPANETRGRMTRFWAIPMVVVPLAAAAFLCFIFRSRWLRTNRKGSRRPQDLHGEEELVWQAKNSEFAVFDFEQLLKATNGFSEENKLGKGGFGAVYKGQLPDGSEIAVKRLASNSGSGQGFMEFKNEVQLIAKLQHRNLVRLLGCCSQEEEKILVYEYLPNKSLDFFLFDENRRALLDWDKRMAIIEGIAHGLVYLHKHSRLCVIHRDLKPSNILLDSEMNPKISDFGLAKIFTSTNTEGSTTRRVVGTYGYMSPEYAFEGLFSIKSDVFSFGVVVLEILCGKRNSGSQEFGHFINLLGHAWQLYKDGRCGELVDASLVPIHHSTEMMRCMNIALLCVQEKAAGRPTMLDVVAMLSNKTMVLVEPKHPSYFSLSAGTEDALDVTQPSTINDLTISIMTGR